MLPRSARKIAGHTRVKGSVALVGDDVDPAAHDSGVAKKLKESLKPRRLRALIVIPGLDPGIHATCTDLRADCTVDGRVKPGHDENGRGDDADEVA
jgi:hypothetical protein